MKPTPKPLSGLREWFPRAVIVGWKYAVDGLRDDVLAQARHQLAECASDACVANGPAHGPGFSLVTQATVLAISNRAELFQTLTTLLARGIDPN